VILGGDVAVCLLLSAHRTVIFAIAQLSCFRNEAEIHLSLQEAQLPPQKRATRNLF